LGAKGEERLPGPVNRTKQIPRPGNSAIITASIPSSFKEEVAIITASIPSSFKEEVEKSQENTTSLEKIELEKAQTKRVENESEVAQTRSGKKIVAKTWREKD